MQKETERLEKLDRQVYCSFCEGKRNHYIVLCHEEEAEPRSDFYWRATFYIVKCAGCDYVAFVRKYGDEDNVQFIENQPVWYDEYTVYPEEPKAEDPHDPFSNFKEIKAKYFHYAPANIKELYKQIVEAFNNQHYILATFGLRALIEGICSELKIKNGYLYEIDKTRKLDDNNNEIHTNSLGGRIFGLYEKGHILFPNALILLEIKKVGNNALHDIDIPHFVNLNNMIKILEKIMDDVYELNNHRFIMKEKKQGVSIPTSEKGAK
ncbi:DUF4145 domain-containing protein [Planococcus sp. YIM B11945]|uniref:DUF4145 domain-containing protein n=1 Tax=Planococcus sp. YIM B11945 TaxID=3435410 RepID=UPI003D7CB5AC